MSEWMSLYIEVPADDGGALVDLLINKLNFTEVDYCELRRPDGATAGYGPAREDNLISSTTDERPLEPSPELSDPPL